MKYKELEDYYLCGIGARGKVTYFEVGHYRKNDESFSFKNGSYNPTVLYKEPVGSNATYVVSATSLQEIDDAELLYKYEGNV